MMSELDGFLQKRPRRHDPENTVNPLNELLEGCLRGVRDSDIEPLVETFVISLPGKVSRFAARL